MTPLARTIPTDPSTVPPPPSPDGWLRPLVAERLGLDARTLVPEVSLTDDLAADSLDLAEVAVAIEDVLGIEVPSARLGRIRTYGELVELATALDSERTHRAQEGVALLRARLVGPAPLRGVLERIFLLDPYAVELVIDDAREAEAGSRLEVTVDRATPEPVLRRLRGRLGRLARDGIEVELRPGA